MKSDSDSDALIKNELHFEELMIQLRHKRENDDKNTSGFAGADNFESFIRKQYKVLNSKNVNLK